MKIHAPMILAHFALKGIHKAVAAHQNVFVHLKPLGAQILAEVSQVSLSDRGRVVLWYIYM